jgi:hypothetical protein
LALEFSRRPHFTLAVKESISAVEARSIVLKWLRLPQKPLKYDCGDQLHLPTLISWHLDDPPSHILESFKQYNFSVFCDVAWDLCRRGLIRPSAGLFAGQGGSGYFSLTTSGKLWLEQGATDDFALLEPGQLSALLEKHSKNFGAAFLERGNEALKCLRADAYLATCVMSGAAAEAVFFAASVKRLREEAAIKAYKSSHGRRQISTATIERLPMPVRRHAEAAAGLLKYWRDDASHGAKFGMGEAEAFTSILVLVRFAATMDENWHSL